MYLMYARVKYVVVCIWDVKLIAIWLQIHLVHVMDIVSDY